MKKKSGTIQKKKTYSCKPTHEERKKMSSQSKKKRNKKKKVTCEFCGKDIPAARLKILPDTSTCVECSQTKPYSESDILSSDISKSQDENKLNLEDFEDNDTDLSQYISSYD